MNIERERDSVCMRTVRNVCKCTRHVYKCTRACEYGACMCTVYVAYYCTRALACARTCACGSVRGYECVHVYVCVWQCAFADVGECVNTHESHLLVSGGSVHRIRVCVASIRLCNSVGNRITYW